MFLIIVGDSLNIYSDRNISLVVFLSQILYLKIVYKQGAVDKRFTTLRNFYFYIMYIYLRI